MIDRQIDLRGLRKLIRLFPVTALLGPRQCGKTTLAHQLEAGSYFDMENPRDWARMENPQGALEGLKGLVVIDEIQRKPELFPLLRFIVDDDPGVRFLILGSASLRLVKESSESLAGRIGYYHLGGFRLSDVGRKSMRKLWLRGGLPDSYTARSDGDSGLWRENFVAGFLERDIPQLGISIPARSLRRFWIMLSHYHGQIVNYSEIGRSLGVSDSTVRRYIDILEGTFMVRTVLPWYANVGKRLVKRPKLYIRDSGIFHSLQSVGTMDDLLSHNKLGASWEGFAFESVAGSIGKRSEDLFFWSTHSGAELDLFWREHGKNWGVEFKYLDAPVMTKSMSISIKDLGLEKLWVIYPGDRSYLLGKKAADVPLKEIPV